MDVDRLQRFANVVKKCIHFQEVTETSELMDPTKVVLNVHYTGGGEHNANPNVAARSYAAFLAATQAIRDGQSLHYPSIPPGPRELQSAASRGATASTASTLYSGGQNKETTNAPPVGSPAAVGRIPQLPPLAFDAMAPCERFKGLVPVSEHTFGIYKWLQKGRDIAEPKVHTEVRRARREATAPITSNLGGTRRGPSSPLAATSSLPISPRGHTATTTASAAVNEESGDDRQYLSVVVILYGRVNFLIQDEMYFKEDGKLVIIDRFLVQPVDAASPQYVKDKASFFRLGRSQVDRVNEKHAVIDFSFKDLKDPIDALRVPPNSGDAHQPRPVFKPPTTGRSSEAVTFGASDASQQGTRKLIVAKNRRGEEEAYEFEIKAVLRNDAEDKRNEDEVMMLQLASRLTNKYDGEVVRLCNNKMTSASNLMQVLRNLVANHFLTVQWIDLSYNQLTNVPDLSQLPLKTLYLHANQIADWQVIEDRVCTLPQLVSVTCHGNPIATTDKDYKNNLLMRLQRAKAAIKGSAPIKLVDFVAVSACDTQVASMYSHFTLGGTIPLVPKFNKDGTVGGGKGTPRSPRQDEYSTTSARGSGRHPTNNSPRHSSRLQSPRRQ